MLALVGMTGISRADLITYDASLSGPAESPPNTSPGTGFAVVTVDTAGSTMRVEVTFSGLTTGTTASHIHAPTPAPFTGTAGVATTTPTFPGFPLGVTSGSYDQTFDMTLASSYNPAFVTANGGSVAAAEAALFSAMAAGEAYLNIHTTFAPGGEIRGFLFVPEPSSLVLAATAAIGGGVICARWRRARRARTA
jgi:hypothetical protein